MTPVRPPQIQGPSMMEWLFVGLLFLLAFVAPFVLRYVL